MGHLFAKFFAYINNGDRGIFNRIVQQPGRYRDRVHFHFSQNQRHFQRVHEVGFAGGTRLPGMMSLGKFVGFADDFQIVAGAVFPHQLHQVPELGDREDVSRDLLA